MCVIVAKPKGVKMPSLDVLRRCWERNPDGAGIAYTVDDGVRIDKGYMSFEEYVDHLQDLEFDLGLDERDVLLHFRIATAGGITPGMTHPFPLSASTAALRRRSQTTEVAVAHNGHIYMMPQMAGLSDTAVYIKTRLSTFYGRDRRFWKSRDTMRLIAAEISSKMTILSPDGLRFIGEFYNIEDVYYSNVYWAKYMA